MKKQCLILALLFVSFCNTYAQTSEELFTDGAELKKDGKVADALEKFKAVVALKPSYYEAWYEMGWCQNDQKNYADALRSLNKARPGFSNAPRLFFELGYAYDKTSMPDSALVNYQKCIALNAAYPSAYKKIAEIYYVAEKYDKTLANYALYEQYATSPSTDYLYWYRKGFCSNALQNYYDAKPALLKSLEFKKDYINTYLELGFANSKVKQNDEAIAYYNQAIALDPKSHVPYNGIAEVYRDNIKDMDKAIEWYQKSLALKPYERKACFGMGYCLNTNAKYSEAVGYLKKAIEGEPNYTAAYVELGYAYYMQGMNDDGLVALSKALALSPKNENARYYKGLIYINKSDKVNAQKMADELKELSSKNANTLQTKVNAM